MKNKKLILLLGTTILSGALVLGAMLGIKSSEKILGTGDEVWNHYEAVSPTLDKRGIKEYWVSCETHESVFVEPASENIVEMGTPSESFINSLDDDDPRVLARYLKGFDFDDGENPYITIKSGFESLSVIDGEGVNGSKCLRATKSSAGDNFLKISKEYLDAVFANPKVKSLSFAAKASAPTNNFRHITVDKSYVNNNNDIISCFERNSGGWGITTTYKTFYLTRGVYSQIDMSNGNLDWFVKYGCADVLPQYLDLDDFRICTTDYYDYTACGFENGRLDGTNILDPISYNSTDKQCLVKITDARQNVGFDYDVKTEGLRSIRFDKTNGQVNCYLPHYMNALLTDDDYITFDYRATVAMNYSNGNFATGQGHPFSCLSDNPRENKWYTLTLPRSEITSDGRFFIMKGSPTPTVWLDNIRVNSAKYSFENKPYTSLFGEYANVTFYDIPDVTASNTMRDSTQDWLLVAEWGGWQSVEIAEGIASDGAYSVKLTTTKSNNPILMVRKWLEIMVDDSVFSFDIYSPDMTFSGLLEAANSREWTTIYMTKDDIYWEDSKGNPRYWEPIHGGYTKGTMYLDNFKLEL